MEECPVYENTHENCGCEHCQQQGLEKEFKDVLNLFFEAERLRNLYNIAVTDELRTACHRSEEALISFLQKTMTEEASRRYVSRVSAQEQ
jgi:wobble nucleotide-excising tRNase